MGNEIVLTDRAGLAEVPELDQVVEAWGEDLEARGAYEDTCRAYRRAVRRFVLWHAGQRGPLDAAMVETWLTSVGGSASTRTLHLAALRSFFAWAARLGHLPTDPTSGVGVKRSRDRAHRRDALSRDEVRAMLDVCRADSTPTGARDAAIIALMAHLGLRTVEVHRADVNDLGSAKGRRVLYIRGKGAVDDLEPGVVTAECWRTVRTWLAVRPGEPTSGPLVTTVGGPGGYGRRLSRRTIRQAVKRRMIEAGIDDPGRQVSTHSLRHAAITEVLRAGGTVRQAQALARHANVTTTEVYLHELDRYDHAPEDLVTYE